MKKYTIILTCYLFVSLSETVPATMYKWIDDDGIIHYSNCYVPEKYSDKVKKNDEIMHAEKPTPTYRNSFTNYKGAPLYHHPNKSNMASNSDGITGNQYQKSNSYFDLEWHRLQEILDKGSWDERKEARKEIESLTKTFSRSTPNPLIQDDITLERKSIEFSRLQGIIETGKWEERKEAREKLEALNKNPALYFYKIDRAIGIYKNKIASSDDDHDFDIVTQNNEFYTPQSSIETPKKTFGVRQGRFIHYNDGTTGAINGNGRSIMNSDGSSGSISGNHRSFQNSDGSSGVIKNKTPPKFNLDF